MIISNQQFELSQQKVNEAYIQFKKVQNEMAENAREAAMLSFIKNLLSGISQGLELYGKLAPGPSATESSEAELRWRDHQMEVIATASQNSLTNLKS